MDREPVGIGQRDREEQWWITVNSVQHLTFCPRQWALIERDQAWDENLYTWRGRTVHDHVDRPSTERSGEVVIEYALPIWSQRHGLVGKADTVEFHPDEIVPVETKHGPRKARRADDLQLTAQAVCLEEMFGQPVRRGFIYHHKSRKRREVEISESLRETLSNTLEEIREWRKADTLPPAPNDQRCPRCSLIESCMPDLACEHGTRRNDRLRAGLFTPVHWKEESADDGSA